MTTSRAIGGQAPRLVRAGERDAQNPNHAGIGGIGGNRQAFGGVDAQTRLHAGDHGARELGPFRVTEGRVDEGAINQPRHPFDAGHRLRAAVIVAQQPRLLARTRLQEDILGQARAHVVEGQQRITVGVVLATLLRRAPFEVRSLVLIGAVDGAHRARPQPWDAGQAIRQLRSGLGVEHCHRLFQERQARACRQCIRPSRAWQGHMRRLCRV